MSRYSLEPVDGIGEIREGDDLAALLAPHVADGDIAVITSKIVSKAEGRVQILHGDFDKDAAIDAETVREVARRGPTRIVRNRLGLTMAAAGVDTSNTELGTVVLLPLDPDASARHIRDALAPNVAVIISDTSGRVWRDGQTDIAIGAAGIEPADNHNGRTDSYGNPLLVTLPATADELAGAAEVASGKLSRIPVVVISGLAELVLPRGQHGPGASALVRPDGIDMFGLGSREAVMAALGGDLRGFGAPAPAEVLVHALATLSVPAAVESSGDLVVARATGGAAIQLLAVATAHGWEIAPGPVDDASGPGDSGERVRLRPAETPTLGPAQR